MFEWDDANIGHIAKHKISPEEAEQVIENNPLDLPYQFVNGEERTVHLGETKAGRILFVVATTRDEMIRVVTAFPPDKSVRKFYLEQKAAENGENSRDP
jgi:uncharacterized protein